MNYDNFTQAELHAAFALFIMNIASNAEPAKQLLTETDKFDAEASMDFIDGIQKSMDAANKILIDSLKRQGLTDDQINARIEYFKDMATGTDESA